MNVRIKRHPGHFRGNLTAPEPRAWKRGGNFDALSSIYPPAVIAEITRRGEAFEAAATVGGWQMASVTKSSAAAGRDEAGRDEARREK